MNERIDPTNSYNAMPCRQERIRVFIGDKMDESSREMAFELASNFQRIDRTVHKTAVLIPVAAHQDASYIYDAMKNYAQQRNCDPFTIFLHLNSPTDHDATDLDPAHYEVERAVNDFPTLDIRSSITQYDRPIIGQIRRDLWNAVMVLASHENAFAPGADDVIGINHDIDTLSISPHYIARVQQYYATRQQRAKVLGVSEAPLPAVMTRVSHAPLPTHPNVAKVTSWIDNSYFQSPGHIGYEAGLVIPFSRYASLDGFSPMAMTHETSWVTGENKHMITGSHLYTSPRRYIDRLAEHGTEGIWLPGSFGANDRCREVMIDDITKEQAEDLILDRLESDIYSHWLHGAMKDIYNEIKYAPIPDVHNEDYIDNLHKKAMPKAEKGLDKAERFLRCVVKSEILAKILRDSIDGEAFVTRQVQSLTLLRQAVATDFDESTATVNLL